jgi:hypothetical protein
LKLVLVRTQQLIQRGRKIVRRELHLFWPKEVLSRFL